ncbi:MAG: alpha-2-macroglobulin family protein [Verrucomicrobiota bacterium]|nr:alpha-2-macroglobulin family protein [Verrucomicrobiota bacterium]
MKVTCLRFIALILILLGGSGLNAATKEEADRLFKEQSFAKAHEQYSALLALQPDNRELIFRAADSLWRADVASNNPDSSKSDEARTILEKLVRDVTRSDDQNAFYAAVHRSLGDYWWAARSRNNWGNAWPHYEQALEWWARSPEIETAREEYLDIVRSIARSDPGMQWQQLAYIIPVEVLENTLQIAVSDQDKALFNYLLAVRFQSEGGRWDRHSKLRAYFEAALKRGKNTGWYDDAIFQYAQYVASYGKISLDLSGNYRIEPDYKKALELYRQLLSEFKKGETPYYDRALGEIEAITSVTLHVSSWNMLTPGQEAEVSLNWRNVQSINLTLYKINLSEDLKLGPNTSVSSLAQEVVPRPQEKVHAWTFQTEDKNEYKPGSKTLKIDRKLERGAYLIVAEADGNKAQDILFVTEVMLVTKSVANELLVFVCEADSGVPVPGAKINYWERHEAGGNWHSSKGAKEANADGLAHFQFTNGTHRELFISAETSKGPTFSLLNQYWNRNEGAEWRIYAFTDRPAYRPEEKVQWKFTARLQREGKFSTPSRDKLAIEIKDPRGTTVLEQAVELNEFGSAWGSLELNPQMPLGEYSILFYTEKKGRQIGSAQLFRLEEYKLPEFKVSVDLPEENGRKKIFRLGDVVEAEIKAEYYFGGAVANATVQVMVYDNPLYHIYRPSRQYEWFYESIYPPQPRWGRGNVIQQETLKTDAQGRAKIMIRTPQDQSHDREYLVEARVTDSSRREIIGSGKVKVTQQSYYVHAHADHHIYRPQDEVNFNFKALDANDLPVQVNGRVRITRDFWYEIWMSPEGREIKGTELDQLRRAAPTFPIITPGKPYQLKFRGYEHEEILTRNLRTGTNGEASVNFRPERIGYYRATWVSEEKVDDLPGRPIRAETTVWVATSETVELGYHHRGLQILADKDTFKSGQIAPVMIHTESPGRHVLFSVEGERLHSYQVIKMEGSTKLLQIPIGEEHVPNFYISGVMVNEKQVIQEQQTIVVPPEKQFAQVQLEPQQKQSQPQEKGRFKIRTLDHEGKPIPAEVALGVVDESVYSIQSDYAPDPRQFFFGQTRRQDVMTSSTLNHRRFQAIQERVEDELKEAYYFQEERLERSMHTRYGLLKDAAYPESELKLSRAVLNVAAAKQEAGQSMLNVLAADSAAAPGASNNEDPVQVRSDFRSTIFWEPAIRTDANGWADVTLIYPDSLTTWKATARVVAEGNRFGIAQTNTITQKPLIVRLQAPRFFVVGDSVTISAVVNNNTDEEFTVRPEIKIQGMNLPQPSRREPVTVPAHGEARVDWTVNPTKAGSVKIQMIGRSEKYSDAMEREYPIHEHGIEKFTALSGKLMTNELRTTFELPNARKPGTTSMRIHVTPSIAITMLDALPYLIDFPYGCTEQTMSRFLPAVIVAKTLRESGIKPEEVMGRAFGGIEPGATNKIHVKGKKDLRQLDEMVEKGLKRLEEFQHGDGGWGWWKDGESDHYMTAYVVWGLALCKEAGVSIPENRLAQALRYLTEEIVEEESRPDLQAWMLHAIAVATAGDTEIRKQPFVVTASNNLWEKRDQLNAYTRALFALAAHHLKQRDRSETLVRNLENGVKRDDPGKSRLLGNQAQEGAIQTAHWGSDGFWWRWSEGPIEATAFALKALLTIDPRNPLVTEVTNWMIKNRRGAQWSNTRDTAISIMALTDYLKVSGELDVDVEYSLIVNGEEITSLKIKGAELFTAPGTFEVPSALIKERNEIRLLRKSGISPLYYSVEAEYFSTEEPISPAGNELFVKREYFKLVGKPTLLKGYIYQREPLTDLGSVKSGDRVEVVLTVETKNDYEYLMFEDLKPAGFEAVQIRSGEMLYSRELKSSARQQSEAEENYTGRNRWVYQELRDRKVAMFIDKLPQGVWQIRYELRAETPGKFHALPLLGQAMYVPEIRSNSSELRVNVLEP